MKGGRSDSESVAESTAVHTTGSTSHTSCGVCRIRGNTTSSSSTTTSSVVAGTAA